MTTQDPKRILETALLCAEQPLVLDDLRSLFDNALGADKVRALLDELARDWQGRGVELVAVASGWRFQSRPEMRQHLDRLHPEKPPRYSRAVLETLAVIAYRQPVTVPEILEIRGVQSPSSIKTLLDKKLIVAKGRKDAVGRPMMYGTSKEFLLQFGLKDLSELPSVEDFHDLSGGQS